MLILMQQREREKHFNLIFMTAIQLLNLAEKNYHRATDELKATIKEACCSFRMEKAKAILHLSQMEGPATRREMEDKTGYMAESWILGQLEKGGFLTSDKVESHRHGRAIINRYTITPKGRAKAAQITANLEKLMTQAAK